MFNFEFLDTITKLNPDFLDQSMLRVLLGDQILLGNSDPSFLAKIVLATSVTLGSLAFLLAVFKIVATSWSAGWFSGGTGRAFASGIPKILVVMLAGVCAMPMLAGDDSVSGYPLITYLYAKGVWAGSGAASLVNRDIQSSFTAAPGTPIVLKPDAALVAKNGVGAVLPGLACAKLMRIAVGDPEAKDGFLTFTQHKALRDTCGVVPSPTNEQDLNFEMAKTWDSEVRKCVVDGSKAILDKSVSAWPKTPLNPIGIVDINNPELLNKFQDMVGRSVDGSSYTPGSIAACVDKALAAAFERQYPKNGKTDSWMQDARPKDQGWLLAGEAFYKQPSGMESNADLAREQQIEAVNGVFSDSHIPDYFTAFENASKSDDLLKQGAVWSGAYTAIFVVPLISKPPLKSNVASNVRSKLDDGDALGVLGVAAGAAQGAGRVGLATAPGRAVAKVSLQALRFSLSRLKQLASVTTLAVQAQALKTLAQSRLGDSVGSIPWVGGMLKAATSVASIAAAKAQAVYNLPGVGLFVAGSLLFFSCADLIPQLILYAAFMMWIARVGLMFPLIALGSALAPYGHGRSVIIEAMIHMIMPSIIIIMFYFSGILFDIGLTTLWALLWHDATPISIAVDLLTGEAVVKLGLMLVGFLALVYIQYLIVVEGPPWICKQFGHNGPGDIINGTALLKTPKNVIG